MSREPIYDRKPEEPKQFVGYYEQMAALRQASKEAHERVMAGYKQIEYMLIALFLVFITAIVVGTIRSLT